MALQSKLFGGDITLEKTAVSDPDHVTPGATGAHVGKIQHALIELDQADISEDSKYGPATAAAVLVYKRKRNIINRSTQTSPDNIVGKLTIASLDREMAAIEGVSSDQIQIRPKSPFPKVGANADSVGRRSVLLLGFKIDVDIPNGPPTAPFLNIRLEPRGVGILEVTSGKDGVIVCHNDSLQRGSSRMICQIFDPADPNPAKRLDQNRSDNLTDGGKIPLTNDPHVINIDAFKPGNSFIDAVKGLSVSSVIVEVRAPKLTSVPGQQTVPLTRTRDKSRFLSEGGFNADVPGAIQGGRPVNPRGGGRKINLGGEGETPDFENYTPDLNFSGYNNAKTGDTTVFRPWTEDTNSAVGVRNGEASDICIRGVPIIRRGAAALGREKDSIVSVIRRIAGPGCRLTFSGAIADMNALKVAFPFKPLEEFPDGEVVIPFPG